MNFQDLLKSKQFANTTAKLPVIFGVDVSGEVVIKDLQTCPHVFIGGGTGTGKTVLLKNIYESLSYKLTPEQCKFIIIDPKAYDFNEYSHNHNLLMPVITEPKYAFNVFKDIVELINNRYEILQHNQKNTDMPYIVIIIDEMADFTALNKDEFENFVQIIVQKARAVGVHLIMATQQLNRDNITDTIDKNMPIKICFKTKKSVLCLGSGGAELLSQNGDMLYSEPGYPIKHIKVIK